MQGRMYERNSQNIELRNYIYLLIKNECYAKLLGVSYSVCIYFKV